MSQIIWELSLVLYFSIELCIICRGQLHHCNWFYHPAAWFQSPSSVMVSAEPFSDRSRPMPCSSSQMWSAADCEPYHGRMSIDKVQWRITTTSRSWRWHSQVVGVSLQWLQHQWNKVNDCLLSIPEISSARMRRLEVVRKAGEFAFFGF